MSHLNSNNTASTIMGQMGNNSVTSNLTGGTSQSK
jgi:hypothetical protein